MTKEKFRYYMDLFESAEKLKNENIMDDDEYNYQCSIILERMNREYEDGDPLDKVY